MFGVALACRLPLQTTIRQNLCIPTRLNRFLGFRNSLLGLLRVSFYKMLQSYTHDGCAVPLHQLSWSKPHTPCACHHAVQINRAAMMSWMWGMQGCIDARYGEISTWVISGGEVSNNKKVTYMAKMKGCECVQFCVYIICFATLPATSMLDR